MSELTAMIQRIHSTWSRKLVPYTIGKSRQNITKFDWVFFCINSVLLFFFSFTCKLCTQKEFMRGSFARNAGRDWIVCCYLNEMFSWNILADWEIYWAWIGRYTTTSMVIEKSAHATVKMFEINNQNGRLPANNERYNTPPYQHRLRRRTRHTKDTPLNN